MWKYIKNIFTNKQHVQPQTKNINSNSNENSNFILFICTNKSKSNSNPNSNDMETNQLDEQKQNKNNSTNNESQFNTSNHDHHLTINIDHSIEYKQNQQKLIEICKKYHDNNQTNRATNCDNDFIQFNNIKNSEMVKKKIKSIC
jgi:hypothetical protein